MEINKTFTATARKLDRQTLGSTIPSGTAHHFNIEPGDTVVYEIKEIIKAKQEPLPRKVSAAGSASMRIDGRDRIRTGDLPDVNGMLLPLNYAPEDGTEGDDAPVRRNRSGFGTVRAVQRTRWGDVFVTVGEEIY